MSTINNSKEILNKTIWGNIAILTGDNYTIFESQAKKALATAGCWKLLDGTENKPEEEPDANNLTLYKRWKRNVNAYEKKRENALRILSTSIDDALVDDEIETALRNGVPQELWNALYKFNQNNNRVWISARRKAFNDEKFDHKNETIQAFYPRLL
ncbi:hypothetical protein K3495_g11007 [Podosphaera aphanis]|nr:hypothetical protein K3495_g11007 [Podosphaera aphanis]